MQMIGQHDECVCREWMISSRRRDRLAPARDMVDEQGLLPLQQIDREEEAPARNEGATVIRHVGENGTLVLPALEIEAADYAFGSNPPHGLKDRKPRA
jgi:hypothetical protein